MSAQVPAPVPASVSAPPPADPLAAWTRPVQGAVAFCFGFGLLFLGGKTFFSSHLSNLPPQVHDGRINLNRADHAELMLLPGIGQELAQRIDDHRRRHGPFRTLDDVLKVPGIGPGTLERLRTKVILAAEPAGPEVHGGPIDLKKTLISIERPKTPPGPLDLNTASAADLETLPGIGKVLAQRIVAERAKQAFAKVDDLRRVKGIGPKTLEKVRPLARIAPVPEPSNQ